MSEKNGGYFLILGVLFVGFAWKVVVLYWAGLAALAAGGLLLWALKKRPPSTKVDGKLAGYGLLLLGAWLLYTKFQSLPAQAGG